MRYRTAVRALRTMPMKQGARQRVPTSQMSEFLRCHGCVGVRRAKGFDQHTHSHRTGRYRPIQAARRHYRKDGCQTRFSPAPPTKEPPGLVEFRRSAYYCYHSSALRSSVGELARRLPVSRTTSGGLALRVQKVSRTYFPDSQGGIEEVIRQEIRSVFARASDEDDDGQDDRYW